ncbi:hypothetical protein CEUSTIGMA_g206.t1 [Chlamydomonas eustigma]|uniref:EF-hand domain-containing protein n=1 Tax=Chlamydomonas eustigma TaxID=1157962 RepID=A0A250WQD2_9CHLO|nr:hypothetical protein CEUSTIGMA_g206.t1 [Chlamydomonas eustigma]|eukprot:GAX72750.1 hypothetical protein CEUSTIGMA_g206.t1 [Chlamydomonas eustigma]
MSQYNQNPYNQNPQVTLQYHPQQQAYGGAVRPPSQNQQYAQAPPQYSQAPPQYVQTPGNSFQNPGAPPALYAQPQYASTVQQTPQAASPGLDPKVASWFQAIDTDRTGSIDNKELQRALAMGHLTFSLGDTDQMIRAFDTKGARTLNLQEFIKLHEFLNNVTSSFNFFDKPPRRALNLDQLVQALRHAGFSMDPPVVQAMFKRHDPDNSSSLSLDEYIRMCLFLQSCVRTFGAFDSQRAGKINLDFNQFVYATSHI